MSTETNTTPKLAAEHLANLPTDEEVWTDAQHAHIPHAGIEHIGTFGLASLRDIRAERACVRRDALLTRAWRYAAAARRARWQSALASVRHVGAQLTALDAASPEAWDVLNAASQSLANTRRSLERGGVL